MTANESKILEIIWNWGGEASIDIIAREAKVSIDYARLFCNGLAKEGYIDFLHLKLCKIKDKGKNILAGKGDQCPQKPNKFGLDKNKKGRLILNYG